MALNDFHQPPRTFSVAFAATTSPSTVDVKTASGQVINKIVDGFVVVKSGEPSPVFFRVNGEAAADTTNGTQVNPGDRIPVRNVRSISVVSGGGTVNGILQGMAL